MSVFVSTRFRVPAGLVVLGGMVACAWGSPNALQDPSLDNVVASTHRLATSPNALSTGPGSGFVGIHSRGDDDGEIHSGFPAFGPSLFSTSVTPNTPYVLLVDVYSPSDEDAVYTTKVICTP